MEGFIRFFIGLGVVSNRWDRTRWLILAFKTWTWKPKKIILKTFKTLNLGSRKQILNGHIRINKTYIFQWKERDSNPSILFPNKVNWSNPMSFYLPKNLPLSNDRMCCCYSELVFDTWTLYGGLAVCRKVGERERERERDRERERKRESCQ